MTGLRSTGATDDKIRLSRAAHPAAAAQGLVGRATARWLASLAVVLGAATAAAALAMPPLLASRFVSVASLLTTTVGIVGCVLTATVSSGSQRWWRLLLGAAYANYGVATLLVALGGFEDPPRPATGWVPIACGLAFYLLALAGLLMFPTVPRYQPLLTADQPTDRRWRVLVVLDSVVVVGSLAYLGWLVLFGTAESRSATQPVTFGVIAATAVGSLVLLAAAVLITSFRRARTGGGLGILTGGIAGLTSINVGFLVTSSQGSAPNAPLLAVGVVAAPLLVAIAALAAPRHDVGEPDPGRGPSRPAVAATATTAATATVTATATGTANDTARRLWTHAMLPYLPLLVVGVVTVARLGARETLTAGQAAALLLLLLGALLRQMVTVADNTRLLARVQYSERRLHYLAYHDPLTGLANRALFGDKLESAVLRHRHEDRRLAVVYCDLDDFKGVNDSLGHHAGDEMLRAAADRLAASVRRSDTVARLGGDEFAIILDGYDDPVALARRLMTELARPYRIGGTERPVLASIGVAVAEPAADVRAATLLRSADVAMYEAKQGGKGQVAVRRLS